MAVFLPNGLFFSEILADNAGGAAFDTDGDGGANKADEFVEIQSINGSVLSLDGIQIWSAKRGLLYDFSSGDTIDPGGTATVVGQYDGAEPAGFYDAGLPDNNSNFGFLEDGEGTRFDTLYLVDTNTGEYIALAYGQPPVVQPLPPGFPGTTLVGSESLNSGAPNGTSISRDANGDLVEDPTPDPGTPGAVCFAAGTLIDTPDGLRLVEDLSDGDLVTTRDNGPQVLRWIGERHLRARDLLLRPHLAPVRVARDAMGPGLPARDLVVSPQHRMLVRSRISERMFGECGVLVPAIKLLDLPGVSREPVSRPVRYFHLLFDRHEIITAEGCPTESLLIGPMAPRLLSPEALAELRALFPDLLEAMAMEPARPIPKSARARQLVRRHARNGARTLIETAA